MAARVSRPGARRDWSGRFVARDVRLDRAGCPAPVKPVLWRPAEAAILATPTSDWPRYRLRVFDLTWPWRASLREVWRDALASGNAQRYRGEGEDPGLYLDACANIQRDPPIGRHRPWTGPRGDAGA